MAYSYYYSGQIRNYIAQFLRAFAGFQVEFKTDANQDGNLDRREVTVYYGTVDRVVGNLFRDKGTYTSQKLPIMVGNLRQIDTNSEIRKSKFHKESIPYTTNEGDRKIIERIMAVPYKGTMEMSIMASNRDQMYQILEQLLLLFNPSISIQKSDKPYDWSYITKITLESISDETQYPLGTETALHQVTLEFVFDFWLNFPYKDHDHIIEEITANIFDSTDTETSLEKYEIDENTPG